MSPNHSEEDDDDTIDNRMLLVSLAGFKPWMNAFNIERK